MLQRLYWPGFIWIWGENIKKEARRLAEEVIESKKFALLDYEKSLNVDMADKDLLFLVSISFFTTEPGYKNRC